VIKDPWAGADTAYVFDDIRSCPKHCTEITRFAKKILLAWTFHFVLENRQGRRKISQAFVINPLDLTAGGH